MKERPLERQVGGSHYKGFTIQPIEFAMANNLDACQTNVLKYIMRNKGGLEQRIEDLNKAIHYIELYKTFLQGEYKAAPNPYPEISV